MSFLAFCYLRDSKSAVIFQAATNHQTIARLENMERSGIPGNKTVLSGKSGNWKDMARARLCL
jgi:hypothetical protein